MSCIVVMIVAGCFRMVLAIRHWHLAGAGLLLLGGLVSIGVGIALYITLPWSGLWVLGTLIARPISAMRHDRDADQAPSARRGRVCRASCLPRGRD